MSTHSSLEMIYETLRTNKDVYGLHYVLGTSRSDYGTRLQCLYYNKFDDTIRVNEVYISARYDVPGSDAPEGSYINVRRNRNGVLTRINKFEE